jgi:hypothetical protein
MSDPLVVEITYRHGYLSSVKLDNLLSKSLLFLKHLIKFTSFDERHDKVETELGLEQVVHTYEEWVIAGKQDILLEFSIVDLVIFQEDILSNRLDRIEGFGLLELCEIYLAEGASAKDDFQFEIFKLDIRLFS